MNLQYLSTIINQHPSTIHYLAIICDHSKHPTTDL